MARCARGRSVSGEGLACDGGGGLQTEVQYILPSSRINRRYVGPEGQINISEYESVAIVARDARAMADKITFETHGFALRQHASAVTDFGDRDQIDRVYVPEMTRFLADVTGGQKVIPFAWMMRTSSPSNGEAQPPANDVHVDHTPPFSEIMAQRALTWCGEPDYPYSRFVAINAWRAYSGAPQDWPLGLCDATSVGDDEGVTYPILMVDELPSTAEIPEVLPGDPNFPDFPEISAFQFRPGHRWFYYSALDADEVVLFKNYDSVRRGAWRVPHAGFRDPTCPATGPRLSIEVRFLVFFA